MSVPTAPAPSPSAGPARGAPSREGILVADRLTKRYGDVTALDALSFAVGAGEVYALLGANGAGKTTAINCFLGFIAPTSGTARVDGVGVEQDPVATKRRLAYIPETVMLYRHLTGLENLEYFATLGTGRAFAEGELLEHLARAGLPADSARRPVGGYSKGMRQKVGIAIALAKDARALLLDEPTSGLDPKASNEFSALLAMLRERGCAILMATHDLFRAKESATRVGIMRHGVCKAELATADIGHADLERIYLEHMTD
jgi:ABC-2 type transport system ATP-binding protein